MRLTAAQSALDAALTLAGRAATNRGAQWGVPVITISSRDGRATASGSDPDLTMECTFPADGESGTLTLPAKIASSIVKSLSGIVTVDADENTATITAGRAKFDLQLPRTGDATPLVVDGDPVVLDAQALAEGLRQVVPSALADDSRAPQLTGVLLEPRDGALRLVATDSYRMAIRDLEGMSVANEAVIIPARALGEVERLVGMDVDEVVTFARTPVAASFAIGPMRAIARVLAGPFPDYARLIPTDFAATFTTNRDEFAAALKRVRVVVGAGKDAATTPVRFRFGIGATLRVVTPETGTAEDFVDGKVEGNGPGEVGFQARYLLDALDAITGDDVEFCISAGGKPSLLRGVGLDEFVGIVMPVRL